LILPGAQPRIIFSATEAQKQGSRLAALAHWYRPVEALVIAKSTDAELLALSVTRTEISA
jgi:hypothetical protein